MGVCGKCCWWKNIMNRHSLCQFLKGVSENTVIFVHPFIRITNLWPSRNPSHLQLYTCLPFFIKYSSHPRGNRLLWRNMNILQRIHTTHLPMVIELRNFCLLQKWPPQPEHYGIDLVSIMGIKRLESNTAEEDNGVLTQGRLSLNPHCPWAVMKANSILGCTDKGKCTFIVEDSSGVLQPSICLGAFLKELDYLQFLLQQEGFVRLLKAFETACRQPAHQCN